MIISKSRKPRQHVSITGRDGYIVCKALAYAIETIEWLPSRWQEVSDHNDMVRLLDAMSTGDSERFRLMARAHIERRGIKVVSGQVELADRDSNDNVIHLQQ